MATFVSLVTCHYCPVASPRRGLIYADSLSVLSRNLRGPQGSPGPRLQGLGLPYRHPCRLTRPHLPQSFAVAAAAASSRPSGSMKHLVLTHLRRLLTISPAHQRRGLRPRNEPRPLLQ